MWIAEVIHRLGVGGFRASRCPAQAGVVRTPRLWPLPDQPATRAMLRHAGISDAMIRTQLAAGRLLVVRHGVFLAASAWPGEPGPQHLVRARAELLTTPAAVLSHQSAATQWRLSHPGFENWWDQPVAITLSAEGHSSRGRGAIHHVGDLPEAQVSRTPEGCPVTSPARTAVDLAANLPLPESLVLFDAAARVIVASLLANPRRRDYSNPAMIAACRDMLRSATAGRRLGRPPSPWWNRLGNRHRNPCPRATSTSPGSRPRCSGPRSGPAEAATSRTRCGPNTTSSESATGP